MTRKIRSKAQSAKKSTISSKAVLYIRVSHRDQADHGVSLAAQEKILTEYATSKGFEVVELVVDAAVSAGKPLAKRNGGAKVCQLVASKAVGHVIALRLDRLFRSVQDCLASVELWDKSGIALHLVQMGGSAMDTASPSGKMMLTMLSAVGEMERTTTAERIKTVKTHQADQGFYLGGPYPIGWQQTEEKKLIENDQEQEIVKKILALHAEGLSIRKIATVLNTDGIKARGSKWHATTVARIIKDAG